MRVILYLVIVFFVYRLAWRAFGKKWWANRETTAPVSKKPLGPVQRKFFTIWVFFVVNIKRLFRDGTALFFTFMFPLIFLFVFGSFSKNSGTNFHVAIINQSHSPLAKAYVHGLESSKIFKIDKSDTTLAQAKDRISKSQIDGIIVLPPGFGTQKTGQAPPNGQVQLLYSQSNASTGQTLTTVLQGTLKPFNARYVNLQQPFAVNSKALNQKNLTSFDYTFTGLLGFAILGAGIFGPMNVFPELKKMGILRRLHTTPLRVWQYFLSVMVGNAVVGLMSLALMLAVSIAVFHLHVVGNYLELAVFLAYGIVVILGIGLSLGGWAKNERQVAPLGNIIVFPMMFLSGVFFPRFLMPQWLQSVSTYLPLTPVIDGARFIVTEGKSLLDVGPQLAIMTVWLVVIYFIAFRVFRWE